MELRLQKSQLEVLPDTLTNRDVEKLERLRQSSPVVPLVQLFSKLEDDEVAPKKVLIQGRAGVGKTTLVEYIAREWGVLELWPHFDYVFVVKLHAFLGDKQWSLSDLLLDGLQLEEHEKRAAFDEICRNSKGVLFLFDGGDELTGAVGHSECRFPIEDKVVLSMIISSIISCSLLPDASVVITTRPTNQIPSEPFDRIVDVYGFTKDGIKKYVEKFCTDNEQLRKFIQVNIDSNPNMATFCHTPVNCKTLVDMFARSESSSVPSIRTMTQLCVTATCQLGRKLHPSLKFDERDLDLEQIFSILKEPFLKHVALAKDNVTRPMKLVFCDDDLRKYGFEDEDKQTGFLSGSKKMDQDDREIRRNTWSFSHLLLQEFFAAVGLIQGPRTDVWKLLADDDNDDITKDDDSTEGNEDNDGDEDNDDNTDDDEDNDSDEDNDDNTDDDEMNDCNENNDDNTDDDDNCDDDDSNIDNNDNSVKQNNIVITFLCGLLGDPRNAYYLKHLGSTDVLLDFYKEFIEKLKGKLENDTFKMVPYIYETQCKDLVDNVPEEIKASKIYPMEMLALCWVLAQDTCRVTSLE